MLGVLSGFLHLLLYLLLVCNFLGKKNDSRHHEEKRNETRYLSWTCFTYINPMLLSYLLAVLQWTFVWPSSLLNESNPLVYPAFTPQYICTLDSASKALTLTINHDQRHQAHHLLAHQLVEPCFCCNPASCRCTAFWDVIGIVISEQHLTANFSQEWGKYRTKYNTLAPASQSTLQRFHDDVVQSGVLF